MPDISACPTAEHCTDTVSKHIPHVVKLIAVRNHNAKRPLVVKPVYGYLHTVRRCGYADSRIIISVINKLLALNTFLDQEI